jgi:hypothetical protein
VPGATATLNVAGRTSGLLVIRFAASSNCNLATPNRCLVRAEINGTEAPPGGVVLDEPPNSGGAVQSTHGMEWSSDPLPPGQYVIQVQVRIFEPECCSGSWVFRGWHLTVERVKV